MGIESKITAQGQISIPAEIRRKLGLKPGSTIEWHEEDGVVTVRRAAKYSSEDIYNTVFASGTKTASIADMDDAIRKRIKKKYARH